MTGEVWRLYDEVAREYDRDRGRACVEEPYLRATIGGRDPRALRILDLGCGGGEPIARFFIERGAAVTGVDAAPAMIEICRRRFPAARWRVADMRSLELGERFDAIVAWDSFFHLPAEDQRAMFARFREHAAPGARLLFTSGPDEGVVMGDLYGRPLHHASLSPREYERLLASSGFRVIDHRVEDPACGEHTVWLAERV